MTELETINLLRRVNNIDNKQKYPIGMPEAILQLKLLESSKIIIYNDTRKLWELLK